MDKKDIYAAIGRKLAGNASEQDKKTIDNWVHEHHANKKILRILLTREEEKTPEIDKVKIFESIKSKIDASGLEKYEYPVRRLENRSFNWWPAVAASIILLITASLYFFNVKEQTDISLPLAQEQIVKRNPKGQKSTIFLSDGTRVILNSASTISYMKDFSKEERKVYLEGEAYFIVAKDEIRPFRVFTDNIITEAVGTEFNVQANEEDIKVSLTEGKIIVSNSVDTWKSTLDPGQAITFNQEDKDYLVGTFDPYETTAWKNGILIFKDASFTEIKERLELWYGVSIKADSTEHINWQITAEFNNKSLESVLKSLKFAKRIDYRINKDVVEIKIRN